jgi:uncharacterized protein YndB with AHSA1/START domain
MTMPVSTSIDVERPPETVFAYVTDPSKFPEWQSGVVSGHMEAVGSASVGDRCLTTRRIGFAERPTEAEVTRVDPPHAWSIHGIDGPIRAQVNVTVDLIESGRSRVTIEVDFHGLGIGKLLVPLMVRPQARREMPANMRRLKERLETDFGSSGPS